MSLVARRIITKALGVCGMLLAAGLNGMVHVSAAEKSVTSSDVILSEVTVVDTYSGKLTPHVSIVISGDKITGIIRANAVPADPSAKSIDLHGKFVVPGYLDIHAHVLDSVDPAGSLALMLANGITGFRQMSGSPQLLELRREGRLHISHDAPALLAMPGTILTPLNAGSPEAAVEEVRTQKARGADFIKVVEVSSAAFFAAQAEAKHLNLPFVGHVPATVNVIAASEGGMKSIEHLGPRDSILLACSTDETALRETIGHLPVRTAPPFPIPGIAQMMERTIINPILRTDALEFARYRRVIETYSEDKCRQLAAKFVVDGTWQVPTLIRERTMNNGDDPQYRSDPNLRYMPPARVRLWEELAQNFSKNIPPTARLNLAALYALQLKVVKLFKESGVKMLAGDDFGGQWLVPGFALHQEFDQLEQAGLSPLEVLQMTTINGAEFLGRTSTMGSVAPGKDAELVLLDANPIDSVQNLHKIFAVVRAGVYYSHDDLSKLKDEVGAKQALPADQ